MNSTVWEARSPSATQPSVHPLLDAWVDAAQQAGHKSDRRLQRRRQQEGVGRHQMTQRNGLRCSSANAFLDDNLEPART